MPLCIAFYRLNKYTHINNCCTRIVYSAGFGLFNVWTYALMPWGISVHTYSGYVHVWSFTPYVWALSLDSSNRRCLSSIFFTRRGLVYLIRIVVLDILVYLIIYYSWSPEPFFAPAVSFV